MKPGRPSKTTAPSPQTQSKKPQSDKSSRRRRKSKDLASLPPPVVTRQGKTTVRRFADRALHRMEETKGKTVEYVELFTSTGHQSIQIRFQDGTSLHCMFEPCFVVEREYADVTTGNWHTLKRWPRIHSQG